MHLSSFGIKNSLVFIKMVIHNNFPIWEKEEIGRKKKCCTIQYCRLILLNAENVDVTLYLYYLWLFGKDNYKNSMVFVCLLLTMLLLVSRQPHVSMETVFIYFKNFGLFYMCHICIQKTYILIIFDIEMG